MCLSGGGVSVVLETLLNGLRRVGSLASAVVSRDGLIVAADLPKDVSRETFSIMCAAIMGAGLTATTELKRSAPRRIILESPDLRVVIFTATKRSIVVVALPPNGNVEAVDKALPNLVKEIEAQGAG